MTGPIFDYLVETYGEERLSSMLDAIEARPAIGDTRTCPGCGRPQHYTGTENGWCHDATFATLACGASPALLAELERPGDRRLISHLTRGCTCDHRPGHPCNASCPVHLGAGLRRA